MTKIEIKKELNKIYKEMKKWRLINKKVNYKIHKDEIERREELLYLQQALYKIEDAKKENNKNEEYFNLALYYWGKATIT